MRWGRWIATAGTLLALAGCASSEEEATTATRSEPKPTLSKAHAEAAFHRAVAEVAKGGLIRVGDESTIETACEPTHGRWGCHGWFVAETGPYCITVYATVNNAGRVGKETYGKLPLGEPGVSECRR